jgi:hypothetical protein
MKTAAAIVCLAVFVTGLASRATSGTEDIELRDLNLTGWTCANQLDGTAKTQDGIERNWVSSSLAFDGLGNSSRYENRGNPMKYWEIIADKLSSLNEARL